MNQVTIPAPRSWWPQQLLIGWLNLVLTAPIIYLFVGLPLVINRPAATGGPARDAQVPPRYAC
ncbi:hypothetical protein [Marinobacterium stanieri]|uniref:hypothetical protein n=1 Tax=Marinobacterium stanieri TaxID=49186 RepID=UPI00158DD5E5|nr:hypothetical protein [Marinobacterium stanieri]